MKLPILFVFILASIQMPAIAAQEHTQALESALSRLNEGTQLLERHDRRSLAVLEEATAMIQGVIDKHQIHTPGIYHALGNAYMLQDDLGQAILAYRKGEEIDPTRVELRESLQHARSMVSISVHQSTTNRIWQTVLAWRGYIPRGLLWLAFAGMFTIGWIACSARLLGYAPRSIATAGIWIIAGSAVPVGLLGAEWSKYRSSNHVVVTGSDVIAMTGPDDQIYDSVFADGLQSGVEALLLESRDEWERIELGDGTQCWVPQASIDPVHPHTD